MDSFDLGIILLDSKVFGARIRVARERLAMSQEELAEAVGRDQRAISEYESGKRKLSAVDVPTYAKVLQVSVLYFFEGEISPQDLDETVVHEFQQLPTVEAKQTAIEFMRLLVNILRFHFDRSS